MPFSMAMPWHEGEEKMHRLMHVPEQDNPTSSMLTPQAANMLQRGPLIAIGTLDTENRPWTTLWGGAAGLSQPLGGPLVGVKTIVDRKHDPVINVLFAENSDGEVIQEQGQGRMIGGLTIDLNTRKRVKIYGRMVAGAVSAIADDRSSEGQTETDRQVDEGARDPQKQVQVQLVVRVDQSLGNCPKYLNRKTINPAPVSSTLVSDSADLPEEARDLILKSDLFFVSSSHSSFDMDTNHRGGPPGFVRIRKNEDGKWELFWPEYSGNRLYQTLGNLQSTPLAGLVFPDFETGDVVYITGETTILIGADAARELPRSNLAVKVAISKAIYVKQGLPFRGTSGEYSPYNPKIRPLTSEASIHVDSKGESLPKNTAKLLRKEEITPTISRYVFSMGNRDKWQAGQWVALDLSEHMDIGYSHMRDDDPLSLNDDFVRTFTVSSPPAPREKRSDDEFEITIRKVGAVTKFLHDYRMWWSELEASILGFGGEFKIADDVNGKVTPFVAGGVGITPLLASLSDLDTIRLRVFWTLHVDDLNFVVDTLDSYPELGKCLLVFITGAESDKTVSDQHKDNFKRLKETCVLVETRRMQKDDLNQPNLSDKWYLCASPKLRDTLMQWLAGKELVYEDFNF